MLPDWIIQYWVQWLFGLIIAVLGFVCRKFYKLYKDAKKEQETKEHDAIRTEIKDSLNAIRVEMATKDNEMQDEMSIIKQGVLNMQSKLFKASCHELINKDSGITLEEFESLQEDHKVYNSLGGNHDGDELYKIAYEKATAQLVK